ncbi:MAG: DUF2214 domain-containing protein [Beijerinckiaceae bacterium]
MIYLQPAIDWLAALGLATGVQRSATVYALVSAAHVLGIALLFGPILLADLRLLGFLRTIDAPVIMALRRAAMLGTGLALAAGVLLLSAKPAEYAANRIVWAKFAVIALALANALRFEWMWRRNGAALLEDGGRAAALLSIALWLTALLLGRWIAFV